MLSFGLFLKIPALALSKQAIYTFWKVLKSVYIFLQKQAAMRDKPHKQDLLEYYYPRMYS